jgi:(p)ppGpp synthase/HD superfamily hydrolase
MSQIAIAYALAVQAHKGQSDKTGVPYIEHVNAVAEGLVPFGDDELIAAGWLHDTLEDTDLTRRDLLDAGITERTVRIVEEVTNRPGMSYLEKIDSIIDPDAILVKVSDNAHNSRADRLEQLDQETFNRLSLKYDRARQILWPMAGKQAVRSIVRIVNPDLSHRAECEFCWSSLEKA